MIEVKLKDYVKLTGGGTPSKENDSYWNGEIPWASVKDFKSDYIVTTVDNITEEGVKDSATNIIPADTLLIATRMAVGKVAFTKVDMAINQDLKAISCCSGIDKKFLFYLLKSKTKYFEKVSSGATVKGIKIDQILDLKISLPSLPTQKKIAAILDAADAYRQKTKALIEKYDQLAQSLFLDMFGDPVTNPRKWEIKKMGKLSTHIGSGNTPKGGSKVYVEKGITFFRSQNVWRNRLEMDDIAFIDEETHNGMLKSSLKRGDILMTKTGRVNTENSSLGRAAMYLGEDDRANLNGHVYLIRLKQDKVNNNFVLFILTTNQYREYIRRVCVGGIDKRQLNKDHLENFPIIYPPITLQNQFAERVRLIEQQKQQAQSCLQKAEDLFNSLLQRAFKGELVK